MDVVASVVAALAVLIAGFLVIRGRRPREAGSFACRLGVTEGAVLRLPGSGRSRRFEAYWVHDVLVVRRAMTPWTVALPVRFPEGELEPQSPADADDDKHGRVRLRLRLDDGAVVAMTAAASAREDAVGPFLAVAVRGLPPGVSKPRPG